MDDRTAVSRFLRGWAGGRAENRPSDGELLAIFATTRCEDAFAELLTRHGSTVLGVCRRHLRNADDADDAFQAVFVVLARRAGELTGEQSLSGWLYGTSVRIAMKSRVTLARRHARETKAALMRPTQSPAASHETDLRAVLDEELERLGPRYRDPVVLCCLEGKTRAEAGRLLGWPEGTVDGRLSRAKELLRDRLARRGVTCSVAGLSVLLAPSPATAVAAVLTRATMAAVSGIVPPTVAILATGVSRGWRIGRTVATVGSVIAIGFAGLGLAGYFAQDPLPEPKVQGAAPVQLVHGSEILAVAVSPSGQVATVGAGPGVNVWNKDGRSVASCTLSGGGSAVAFAPDGKSVAAACYDGAVRVWNPATGTLRLTLEGHGDTANAVAFSLDGGTIATAGEDGRVQLWDAVTGKSLRDLEGHRGHVWGIAFSPNGHDITSAGGDQTVRIWNLKTGDIRRKFTDIRGGAYAVSYHPSGETLAVAASNTVVLLDADSGREVARVGTERTAVTWFAFAPDGRTLAYRDGKAVRMWEVASRSERLKVELAGDVSALAFATGGKSLVAAVGKEATVIDLVRRVRPIEGADATALWRHLEGPDAVLAGRAVAGMIADPTKAVPLIRDRLHAVPDLSARIDTLLARLADAEFATREQASRDLAAIGSDAGPALRRTLATVSAPEVRRRVELLLARLPIGPTDRLTAAESRAVEVLENLGTADAHAVLTTLAGRELDTPLKREAAAALARLKSGIR